MNNSISKDGVWPNKKATCLIFFAIFISLAFLFATAPKPAQVALETFEYGNLSLQLWGGVMDDNRGLVASPLWVQYFLKSVFGLSVIGLFFMPKRIEARWAAGGFLASQS